MERCGWDRQLPCFPFNTIPHHRLRYKKTVSADRSKEEMGKLQRDIYKASVDLPVDKSSGVFGPPRTYCAAEALPRRRTRRRTVLSRLTRVHTATRSPAPQLAMVTRHLPRSLCEAANL